MAYSSNARRRCARSGRALAGVLAALAGACAPAVPRAPLAPAEIPVVEARLAADASDTEARLQLADAYRQAGRPEAAAALLQPARATEPAATYFLALVREQQGDFPEARRLYNDYLARGRDAEVRGLVRDRLQLLGRLELQRAAQDALRRERELASTVPAPGTVGVFPFLAATTDPQLSALGTAMAELLTTDLAQTSRLKVVERAQVAALLNELKLTASGRVDPATAARSGRLIGAGQIVQGRVEGTEAALSLQAAVLQVGGRAAARAPLQEQDQLARLFDLEKRMALGIYERLGIQLTDAERQRVMQRPTTNVQALLALGFGLEAQDAGRYAEAAQQFGRAAQLDPQFRLPAQKRAESEAQDRAVSVTPVVQVQLGFIEFDAHRRRQNFEILDPTVPDPGNRDVHDDVLGPGTIQIIIKRPGGAQ
ncbi:MAG: hypothetical protein FIB01_08695 [Gemmatimonadetes bacterium]|nr:hypothetical protein [Gemmatimonadota bacterium]